MADLLQLIPAAPHEVAADTFVIPTFAPEPGSGAVVSTHSLVIRAAEPVIVDTGCSLAREGWLDAVWSVVEPADVRWVFLSHDDHDHIGNLLPVLEACPQATLVASWSITSRLGGDVELPLARTRWLDGGDALDVGDRTLRLVRPPMFDSPATRGLFDERTGVLWAVDSFGALVQAPVLEADDADAELYDGTFDPMNQWNTPWLEWLDPDRYAEHVRRSAELPIAAVACAHGPILRGDRIQAAFERTAALAARAVPPTPDQSMLDELLAAFAAAEQDQTAA